LRRSRHGHVAGVRSNAWEDGPPEHLWARRGVPPSGQRRERGEARKE
jgi:hypothetical protein